MRGELPSQLQTTCNGNSRCSSVCRLARIEWNNRGQPETPARRSSRVISLRRFAFFQPIAVLAAARYWGAATTYSLLSPKISKASSKIGRSSGKIGQLRIPRPSWCSTFGSGILIRFSSQSMSSQRSDNVSGGVLGHRTSENLPTQNPLDLFVETEHFLVL